MASYSVAAGKLAVHDKTLTANTADTVTFADDCDRVEVLSDGTAALYFSVDGVPATVSGSNCFKVPASLSSVVVDSPRPSGSVVSLISAGTPTYSVTRVA